MKKKDFYYLEFIKHLKKIISYKTTLDIPVDGGPFGQETKECLEYVLELAKSLGFEIKNNKGYYGIAKTKTSFNETLGILGHLDVVPASSEGWISSSPFSLEEIDGILYGRGLIDDKGPILACLFALKELIEEGNILKRNINIIFGCNEETGMLCMKEYNKSEKLPNISFTPDADFPVINLEKGIINLEIKMKQNLNLKSLKAGRAANIVIDNLNVVYNTGKIENFKGKAAHSSTPELGDNAFIKFLKSYNNEFAQFLFNKLNCYYGKNLNIDKDCKLSGKLTMNVGLVEIKDDYLYMNMDIRTPLNTDEDFVVNQIKKELNCEVISKKIMKPLYVDENNELVKTLMEVYNEYTNSNLNPISCGGTTYAKTIKNCVAFGPQTKEKIANIHDVNEHFSAKDFKDMYYIYKKAIKKLAFN